MADRCASCGAHAVIQEEIDEGEQRICTECGTVAAGPRNHKEKGSHNTNELSDTLHYSGNDVLSENICESCGDQLPYSLPEAVKICSECQEFEDELSGIKKKEDTTDEKEFVENDRFEASHDEVEICKSCGSKNLSQESIGADERIVCCDCGTVVGREVLTNDHFDVTTKSHGNTVQTLPFFAKQLKKCRGLETGKEKIVYLQNKFCFPEKVKEDAEEMFKKIFYKRNVLFKHISTKAHIATACVFVTCRMHDIPVCMTHFAPFVDRFSLFIKAIKIVTKSLGITVPHICFSNQVSQLLLNHGLISVISKTQDILFLCRRAWLTQGRSREGLIVIAAYYAYRSTGEAGSDITMKQFRKKFSFPQSVSQVLQTEIGNMFLKLACNIPWVSKRSVKPSSVPRYINDILKYQNSLFQLAFKCDDSPTSPPIQTIKTGYFKSEDLSAERDLKVEERHNFKRNLSASFKDKLLPSAMKKKRYETPIELNTHIAHHIDLDSPILKASEFDDNEIESYIFTPEEEERVKTPKMKFVDPGTSEN